MNRVPTGSARERIVLASAVVLLAASCGRGANAHHAATVPDNTAFIAAVGKVCARAVQAHAGHSFPLSAFDPDHPDPDQLPAVGTYFARYGALPATTAALHALPVPTSDAAAWRRLLTVADQIRDNAQRQIAAAQAKDVTAFVATVHTAQRLIDELETKGAHLGFTSSSPCRQVFG
jgi:hypothetical protein